MNRTSPQSETVTLHVPFRIVKRGGRKEMVMPSNTPDGATLRRRTDSTLVKALARAFRWKRMLDSGEYATIAELAERERIARSYVARLLQLTNLAPDIVEAIVDGRADTKLSFEALGQPLPDNWDAQRQSLQPARY